VAESVPVHENDDLAIKWSKFEQRFSHSAMNWIDRGIEKLDVIGLAPKERDEPEKMRSTAMVLEKTLVSDAEEPGAILGDRWDVVDPSPRDGEYL
jgi:hypothetical protein